MMQESSAVIYTGYNKNQYTQIQGASHREAPFFWHGVIILYDKG
jgi:hypothetical protein